MQTYKIFNGIDVNSAYFLDLFHLDKTTNCTDKMPTEYSRTNIGKFYFGNRVVAYWNTLRKNVLRAQNLNFRFQKSSWDWKAKRDFAPILTIEITPKRSTAVAVFKMKNTN